MPDYSYWLNLGEEDVEVIASPGILVLIPSMGGAVFHRDCFLSTEWNSRVIPLKESKQLREKAMIYEDVEKRDAYEWSRFNEQGKYQIESVYSCKEDLGEDLLLTHFSSYGILGKQMRKLKEEVLDGCFDYAKYANRFLNKDYFELSSGKIIKFHVEE